MGKHTSGRFDCATWRNKHYAVAAWRNKQHAGAAWRSIHQEGAAWSQKQMLLFTLSQRLKDVKNLC